MQDTEIKILMYLYGDRGWLYLESVSEKIDKSFKETMSAALKLLERNLHFSQSCPL